jgi:hypothetical protein
MEGTNKTCTVVLTSEPVSIVTVPMINSAAGQISVTPAKLTSTTADWGTAQTVTVAAIDDHIAEGPKQYQIAHTAASSGYKYGGAAKVPHANL